MLHSKPSCRPALESNTLIYNSNLTYKSETAYVTHETQETKSLLISKEEKITTLELHLTGETPQILTDYFILRAKLGMPVKLKTINLIGEQVNTTPVQNVLNNLGYTVTCTVEQPHQLLR